MLEKFRKAQQKSIDELLALKRAGALPAPLPGPRPSLAAALRAQGPGAIIAEYKRASPSRGDINLALSPEEAAAMYAGAGAAALSVLTERDYFKGDLGFMARMAGAGLPMLRKDFLLHPVQVAETAATPASALLLIMRMLDDWKLAAMLKAARQAGLEAVLEIFDQADLERARAALEATGASPAIIQVNNRDLQTLAVDESASRKLAGERRPHEIWISASGARAREQVLERAALGYDAVLVGSALMGAGDPGARLAMLAGRAPGDPAPPAPDRGKEPRMRAAP